MRHLLNSVVILAATLVLYCAVDLGFGYVQSRQTSFKAEAIQSNPAYRSEPDASPSLMRELIVLDRLRWRQTPGEPLLEGVDYHSDVFNIDRLPPTGNTYRRTINPAAGGSAPTIVLLVGASVVYGPMVADRGTLASALSARLNDLDPAHRYIVYNAGMPAADARRIEDRIAYEIRRGLKPNIIISYAGNIDALSFVYYDDPKRSLTMVDSPEDWATRILPPVAYRYLPLNIYQYFRRRAVSREMAGRHPALPSQLRDSTKVAALVRQAAQEFYDAQVAIAALATRAGARYIAILEPNSCATLFTHPTADVTAVMESAAKWRPGMVEALRAAAPALSAAVVALRAQGIDAVDLTSALKDKTLDVYYDLAHLNSLGYRMVADRIADVVLQTEHSAQP